MDSNDIIKEIVKANATDFYRDSAQPSVRVLGKSLAQCVSLLASPVGQMAEIFEKNICKYLNKLDRSDENNLIPPDVRIAVPILEKMRYIEEEKVADYYAEILATASQKDQKGKVILSFIEILNRVTADEIKILEYINSYENKVDISSISDNERKKIAVKDNYLMLKGSLPVLDIKLKSKNEYGYLGMQTITKNFNIIDEKIKLNNPQSISIYLDNLFSLGLIEKPYGISFSISAIYDHLKEHPEIEKLYEQLQFTPEKEVKLEKGRINITDLCKNLLDICQDKDNRNYV